MAPPTNNPYGDIDGYGRPHDASGATIFKPQRRLGDEDIGALDAFTICELPSVYNPPDGIPEPEFPDGRLRPRKLIATSPNMPFIPNFNLGLGDVRIRKDGRFGVEDFTLWPQLYYQEHPHLPFVLRRPPPHELPNHPLRMIWWDVTERDHVPERGSFYDGLGKLSAPYVDELKDLELRLTAQVRQYQDENGGQTGSRLNLCANAMRDTISRLRYAAMTFRNLVQNVAAFQRQYLETRAWLDMLQKWTARLGHAVGDVATGVELTIMGCGTYDTAVVQSFFRAGIPVWYIRPPFAVPLDINIDMVISPDYPKFQICIADWEGEPFPTLYSSWPSAARLAACSALPPGGFMWKNAEIAVASPVESVAGPIRVLPASSRPEPYPACNPLASKKQRSSSTSKATKFLEPVANVMPPAIPLWTDALRAVDTDTCRLVDHPNKGLLVGYQFPDPHIFLSTSRQSVYVAAWLSCRAGWVQSVVSNCAELPVPKTQQWRDFLYEKGHAIDPANSLSGPLLRPMTRDISASASTRKGTPARLASKSRRRERLHASAQEIFSLRLPTASFPKQIFWNELAVQHGDVSMLTPAVTSQIVWDLFEHNFRLELLALDRCVMAKIWRDPLKAAARDDLLKRVFPGDSGYLVGAMPSSNQGLAAEKWDDRMPYVENFRVLVSDWPGESAALLKDMKVLASPFFTPRRSDVEQVEVLLTHFYCQTFFDYFGRAAITPHRIPRLSSSSST